MVRGCVSFKRMIPKRYAHCSLDSYESKFRGADKAVSAKADDQTLYFEALGMQSYGRDKQKLTMQGAAEFFWDIFIRPLQQ